MEIRNRIADVVKLRCNTCQDFLKMFLCENWQEKLYNITEEQVTGPYRDKYIGAYNRMRDVGFTNYKVEDMDITFIYQIVKYCKSLTIPISKATKDSLEKLKDDRNITQHASENEKPEELYLRCLFSLCNLADFVKTVDQNEIAIDNAKRLSFRQDYISKIDNLKKCVDEERISLIQRQKEIDGYVKKIQESTNPLKTFADIMQLNFDRYSKIERDDDKYYEFPICASNAGIKEAHPLAAQYFLLKKNYDEAERRLWMLYDACKSLPVFEAISGIRGIMDSINSYLWVGNSLTSGMKKLINEIREKIKEEYCIIETDNIYKLERKKK